MEFLIWTLGAVLLYDALKHAAEASQVSAAYAVIVDALNEQAKKFICIMVLRRAWTIR